MTSKQHELIKFSYDKGYQVDSDGKVYNYLGGEIKLSKTSSGYYSFNIRMNGSNPTRVFVHRLQAYQKFGDKLFTNGIVVRHLNGDSTDNSINNIDIGTQQDNMLDVPKNKRILNASNPKYNHIEIINDYKNGLSTKELMEKYKIKNRSSIFSITKKSLVAKGEYPII